MPEPHEQVTEGPRVRADFGARLGGFDLDVRFEAGRELVALYGRSGSGKSLTLRAIAGLLRPGRGRIEIGGRAVFDAARGLHLPPQERRTGYVIQELALFPHLTVEQNVLIGVERDPEAARRWVVLRDLLELGALAQRRPQHISGGQQQRVALARALVRPAEVLLLDEPFSALDEALRTELRTELQRVRRELALPIVFVTHDLREAHLLADRIAVLDEGRVRQFAPRDEVFRRPADRRVAELTGVRNVLRGRADGRRVEVAGCWFELDSRAEPPPAGPVDLAIRAERLNLRRFDPDGTLPPNCFVARVVGDLAFGNTHTLHLAPEGAGPPVEVEVAARPYEVLGVAERDRWVVELPPGDLHAMPPEPTAGGGGAVS